MSEFWDNTVSNIEQPQHSLVRSAYQTVKELVNTSDSFY